MHDDQKPEDQKPNDYPLPILQEKIIALLERCPNAVVHIKFTCEACGERVAFDEPFKVYERGECCHCGHETPFTVGGLQAVFPLDKSRK